MSNEWEVLEKKLRHLRFDDPAPSLRTRTLNAMHEELVRRSTPEPPAWLAGLKAWRTEALYSAAVLVCLVFVSWLGPSDEALSGIGRRASTSASVSREAIVRELRLTGDLANHVSSRLALQWDLRPKRRIHHHDFQRNDPSAEH